MDFLQRSLWSIGSTLRHLHAKNTRRCAADTKHAQGSALHCNPTVAEGRRFTSLPLKISGNAEKRTELVQPKKDLDSSKIVVITESFLRFWLKNNL